MMDTLDGPYASMKERKKGGKTQYQSELQMKLSQRRQQGLTWDMTSEESDTRDDGVDSEEENSFAMEYRKNKRTDRPTSAKRRTQPSLENTLRAGDASRFIKSSKPAEPTPAARGHSPSSATEKSPRFARTSPSQDDLNRMFGSPKSRTSPKEEGVFSRSLTSPTGQDKYKTPSMASSMSSALPRTIGGDRTSPGLDRKSPGLDRKSPKPDKKGTLKKELSKEELIFGRKTPTDERTQERSDWKAPSFRKASPTFEPDRATTPTETSRGRKTPTDGLQSITESPRPQPRQRTSPKDAKMRNRDSSPKPLSFETSPRDNRPKPKVDIFGRKEKQVNLDDDEDEYKSRARERRRFGEKDRRTPPINQKGRQTPPEGRKTPTGRTTPTGRQTPTGGRQAPGGRQTPTGRHTPTDRFGKKTGEKQTKFDLRDERERRAEERQKKEPGLFDFLMDDDKKAAKSRRDRDDMGEERGEKPRPRLRKPEPQQSSMKKSVSHDSITDEFGATREQPSMLEESSRDVRIQEDQSSVCAEVDRDPYKQQQREKEREKYSSNQNQRSDRREADDIINSVQDAQVTSQFQTIKKERPASAKTKDSVHRPQPRHSLPGSSASEMSEDTFNSTTSIRQAIFDDWKRKRDIELKKKKAEQTKKEEEEKKKKEQAKKDKLLESKMSYDAWLKERGTSFVKEKNKEKKEEEKKKHEKEREERLKQKDALMNFKKWKESKDELIHDEHKKRIEEKHRKLQNERTLKTDKEKQNSTAFDGWKRKKDKVIEENEHKKRENKRQMQKTVVLTQKQKENEAIKEYNEWMRKKEDQNKREQHMKRLRKLQEQTGEAFDFKPPWSPASKTIPAGR